MKLFFFNICEYYMYMLIRLLKYVEEKSSIMHQNKEICDLHSVFKQCVTP